jgi:hypothetical protein
MPDLAKALKFRDFIQTVLANFYLKLAPCIRQTQFLSKLRIRASKPGFFFSKFFGICCAMGLLTGRPLSMTPQIGKAAWFCLANAF